MLNNKEKIENNETEDDLPIVAKPSIFGTIIYVLPILYITFVTIASAKAQIPIFPLILICCVALWAVLIERIKTTIDISKMNDECYFNMLEDHIEIRTLKGKYYQTLKIKYSEIEEFSYKKRFWSKFITKIKTSLTITLKTGEIIVVPYVLTECFQELLVTILNKRLTSKTEQTETQA